MAPRRLEFVRFLLYVSVPLTAFWWSNSAKNVQTLRDYVRFPFPLGRLSFTHTHIATHTQFGYVKKDKGHTLEDFQRVRDASSSK
jgi:hypothetical protein